VGTVINRSINHLCVQPPDELMVDTFLPAMRQLVTLNLRSRGLSQSKISSLLGITQASVSLYLSSDPKRAYQSLARMSVLRSEADGYVGELAESVARGAADGVETLNTIWTEILGSGAACAAHRELYPALSDCDVCVREYGRKSIRSKTISEVADAVKMLEESPRFAAVMPEVSVNIACASGDARSPADVVAVPGRIVRVKGRARAMLPPEAGASVHMAKVLLLARSRRPDLRACINIRYDRWMADGMKREGLRVAALGAHRTRGPEDPTVAELARRLGSIPDNFDALVDQGGGGIEPNVYLFAGGAREVATLALRLAYGYSAG